MCHKTKTAKRQTDIRDDRLKETLRAKRKPSELWFEVCYLRGTICLYVNSHLEGKRRFCFQHKAVTWYLFTATWNCRPISHKLLINIGPTCTWRSSPVDVCRFRVLKAWVHVTLKQKITQVPLCPKKLRRHPPALPTIQNVRHKVESITGVRSGNGRVSLNMCSD